MSEREPQGEPVPVAEDGTGARDPRSPAQRAGAGDFGTVGTGSVLAIGCTLGLLLLVLGGVAFLMLLRVV